MSLFTVNSCPVCDNTGFDAFIVCTDYFVSGEKFGIKQCGKCGFKITHGVESEENIGRYYQSENYISHSNTSKGFVNRVYHQVRTLMLRKKSKLVEKATGGIKGSILDIGTGTGYFLDQMKTSGWKVTGTEKSSDARNFSKTRFGLDVFPTEELENFGEGSFDVITLWHVLEHIHRIKENFEAFQKLLKPNGKLIIAVPNHSSFDARHYGEYWAAWDVPRHIWHFAPAQMKLIGEKYGFKLTGVKPLPFDSFYVSILSEKYRKSGFPTLKGLFFGKISWMISLFNPRKCSSVIYLFSKN